VLAKFVVCVGAARLYVNIGNNGAAAALRALGSTLYFLFLLNASWQRHFWRWNGCVEAARGAGNTMVFMYTGHWGLLFVCIRVSRYIPFVLFMGNRSLCQIPKVSVAEASEASGWRRRGPLPGPSLWVGLGCKIKRLAKSGPCPMQGHRSQAPELPSSALLIGLAIGSADWRAQARRHSTKSRPTLPRHVCKLEVIRSRRLLLAMKASRPPPLLGALLLLLTELDKAKQTHKAEEEEEEELLLLLLLLAPPADGARQSQRDSQGRVCP